MGLLDKLKSSLEGDPFDKASNIQISFDFDPPVSEEKFRYKVIEVSKILVESDYCEKASGLQRLCALDKKSQKKIVGVDMQCYGIKHKGRANLCIAVVNLVGQFKKIGIKAEINTERTGVLPENYQGLFGQLKK